MVQWLRLRASTARGMGSIPGQGSKIPHGAWWDQKKKKKKKLRMEGQECFPHPDFPTPLNGSPLTTCWRGASPLGGTPCPYYV